MEASRSLMSVIPMQPSDLLQDSAVDDDMPRLVPDDRSLQFDDAGCLIIREHYFFEIGGGSSRPHESTSAHASNSSASRTGPGSVCSAPASMSDIWMQGGSLQSHDYGDDERGIPFSSK